MHTVAIIGVGLIGGSFGLALKKAGFTGTIVGASSEATLRAALARGVIDEGMIPKVEACLESLRAGVRKTHMIDGRVRHSLLLEIYTDRGVVTEIVLQR